MSSFDTGNGIYPRFVNIISSICSYLLMHSVGALELVCGLCSSLSEVSEVGNFFSSWTSLESLFLPDQLQSPLQSYRSTREQPKKANCPSSTDCWCLLFLGSCPADKTTFLPHLTIRTATNSLLRQPQLRLQAEKFDVFIFHQSDAQREFKERPFDWIWWAGSELSGTGQKGDHDSPWH